MDISLRNHYWCQMAQNQNSRKSRLSGAVGSWTCLICFFLFFFSPSCDDDPCWWTCFNRIATTNRHAFHWISICWWVECEYSVALFSLQIHIHDLVLIFQGIMMKWTLGCVDVLLVEPSSQVQQGLYSATLQERGWYWSAPEERHPPETAARHKAFSGRSASMVCKALQLQ